MPTSVPLAVPPLLAGFPDPVLAFDQFDKVVAWNPAAERVYGLPAPQALGTSVWMLVPRKNQRPFARACEAVRRDGHWAGELVTLAASDAVRLVDARWSGTPGGTTVAVHTEVGDRRTEDGRDRRADRWAAARALAAAAADSLPAAAGPARDLLARTGRGPDPAADPVFHGAGAWVLVAVADPLPREVARAVLDAAGYTVLAAADRSAANRQAAANREKVRAAVVGFGPDTPAVGTALQRYRALLPVVPLLPGFDPAGLLERVAEAVGRDQVFDPDSEVH